MILLFISFKVKAQTAAQQGFTDGQAFGEYVISTYVSPNLPPESEFVSIAQGSSFITVNGNQYFLFSETIQYIDQALYANACTEYAYQYGILTFYRDYIQTTLTNANMPLDYIDEYNHGYMSRMKGRVTSP